MLLIDEPLFDFNRDLEALIPGYIVVVDKIQTHENADGKPEVDK